MEPEQRARIDARLPLAVRERIDLAARLQGRSRTDFLIEAACEKADQVIARHLAIQLSPRDQALLAESLDAAAPAPSPFLCELAQAYATHIRK